MEKISAYGVVKMLESIANVMDRSRDYLIELDSAIGDGDLGITMAKSFRVACTYAKEHSSQKSGELLMHCGMQIVKSAPSTMGTLMGSGFMYGGKEIRDRTELNAQDLVVFFDSFLKGVLERGKAKQGDKTIVDILYPLVETMKSYQGNNISELLKLGANGARKGLEDENGMMSQHGKAAVFREKTMNLIDPGSMAMVFFIEACRD
ncbi:MAG: dihydroxyacetone kinase subunit L, partial [Sphaerochaetaceae bacterium]